VLADPRFQRPLSGLYWQIQDLDRPTLLRSRSLWDAVVELPEGDLEPGKVHQHTLDGPTGEALLVRERRVIFQTDGETRRLRIAIAVSRQELVSARDAFAAGMLPYLAVIALLLILAAWVQVAVGLSPLDAVRRGVSAVRSGERRRLGEAYPHEVMPLVDEMNALLDAQERAIADARAWTADLAHGLKTPLMVLTADSQRLRERGDEAMADDLDQLAETVRRRVDRELIRARLRSGFRAKQTRSDVPAVLRRIVRTLRRTPRGAELDWVTESEEALAAAIAPDDLAELLGNLLENAVKWADRVIRVSVTRDRGVRIRIEDDGPGVPQDQLANLGRRGLRLDEKTQGTGLGLAIVLDIVEAYRGEIAFARSAIGGLAAEVLIPTSP
jgi:signal transduction histidine kinase